MDDAASFASWGVDMLKYDSCYHMGRIGTPQISFSRFKAMSDALIATGRSILLNLCNWGEDYVHTVSCIPKSVCSVCHRPYVNNMCGGVCL